MEELKRGLNFLKKNWTIGIPSAIGALIIGVASVVAMVSSGALSLFSSILASGGDISESQIMAIMSNYGVISLFISAGGLVVSIFTAPSFITLIRDRVLYGKNADKTLTVNEYWQANTSALGRWILFLLASTAVSLGIGIVFALILLVTGLLTSLNVVLGILMILFVTAAMVAGAALIGPVFTMWYAAAMDCTQKGVFSSLPFAFELLKGVYWKAFGITLLIGLVGGAASSILSAIPLVGSIVSTVVTTAVTLTQTTYIYIIYGQRKWQLSQKTGALQ